jgi:hypothetical protein
MRRGGKRPIGSIVHEPMKAIPYGELIKVKLAERFYLLWEKIF